MRILLIADNHGKTENMDKILKNEKYDMAIHLGDGMVPLQYLKDNFDYYVCGNHEDFEPLEKFINIDGINTFIFHGHTHPFALVGGIYMKKLLEKTKADMIIHGHAHRFESKVYENKHVICPGSIDYPRGPEGKGYTILETMKGKITNVQFVKI